jgi:hypothetical protein
MHPYPSYILCLKCYAHGPCVTPGKPDTMMDTETAIDAWNEAWNIITTKKGE